MALFAAAFFSVMFSVLKEVRLENEWQFKNKT